MKNIITPRQLNDAQFTVGHPDAAFIREGAKWDKIILWIGLAAVISALAIVGFGG